MTSASGACNLSIESLLEDLAVRSTIVPLIGSLSCLGSDEIEIWSKAIVIYLVNFYFIGNLCAIRNLHKFEFCRFSILPIFLKLFKLTCFE